MPNRLLLPRPQAVGGDGRPLAGAKIYTYTTGTSTPKAVYTTAALSVAHPNPVEADAAGRWPSMFLAAGEYRVVLTDANNNTISTDDNVTGFEAPGSGAAGTIPVAALIPYAGSSAPTGWLFCHGQAISRTTYADLFAVIGVTYGAGDGSSTFNLPDLRGRAVWGKDNMGGSTAGRVTNGVSGITGTTLGAAGGDERLHLHSHALTDPGHTHSATAAENGDHSHSYTNNINGSWNGANNDGALGTSSSNTNRTTGSAGTHTHAITVNGATTGITAASAGSGSSQNMPPAIILNYIIFADV